MQTQDKSEDDVTLQFTDSYAAFNTYNGEQSSKSGVLFSGDDSNLLDDKTPGGSAIGMQGLQ